MKNAEEPNKNELKLKLEQEQVKTFSQTMNNSLNTMNFRAKGE